MRGWLYDHAITSITKAWYASVMDMLPHGAHVLDVGIGTAGALCANAEKLHHANFVWTGIDIDIDYVTRARKQLQNHACLDVVVHHQSLAEHVGGPYDAIYFAGSFMLFNDPIAALRDAMRLLKPDGKAYFTLTLEAKHTPCLESFKPLLRHIISIDFGHVTYEETLLATLRAGGFEVTSNHIIKATRARSSRLVVARPLWEAHLKPNG